MLMVSNSARETYRQRRHRPNRSDYFRNYLHHWSFHYDNLEKVEFLEPAHTAVFSENIALYRLTFALTVRQRRKRGRCWLVGLFGTARLTIDGRRRTESDRIVKSGRRGRGVRIFLRRHR